MGVLEEVKKMQRQGLPETEIIRSLQDKRVPYRDISEALAQSKIKSAIEAPASDQTADIQQSSMQPVYNREPQTPSEAIPGMQKSMLQPESQSNVTEEYMPYPEEEYAGPEPMAPSGEYANPEYGSYTGYEEGYEYPATNISPDTIAEISEQILSEKITDLRKHIEKAMDFKTTIETKTEAIEERLRRIEKIIDALQDSVLKKVGSYVTNVDDIKKELIETQKTFAKLAPDLKKHYKHKHHKHKTHKTTKRKKSTRKKK